ncbi:MULTISPECIES: S8 family serine peptidase [Haloferax]|uniref:S8 family serine peptidase n=1 Tax=Haloferax TaxID=2251 RepID=UPI001CD94B1C|nr:MULTISPECIES: S8 family serine peptidase [Haloferax]
MLSLTVAISVLAITTAPTQQSPPATTASTDPAIASLHERGYNGSNVTVGVVDVTGFDTDHPALNGQVAATRTFGSNNGDVTHGTASAAVVAHVAPDADLYLASFDDVAGYRAAIAWLVEEDVDVIVAPVSFFGRAGDGSSPASRAAMSAVRKDTVFVAPAGNVARGHWSGRYDRTRNELLHFEGGTRNFLQGDTRSVRVWLSWDKSRDGDNDATRGATRITDDTESGGRYVLELYRTDGRQTELVARSSPVEGVSRTQRLVTRVDPGQHFLVVRGPSEATGDRLTIVSPTTHLQYGDSKGSVVAPATARGVISVGAYDRNARRIEPFSARGPTEDGRLGIDIVAPDRMSAIRTGESFVGTSAAAPYAAGVAALVLDAHPELSPRAVEALLETTATDVGPDGVDHAGGHGLIAPVRAVSTATNESSNTRLSYR